MDPWFQALIKLALLILLVVMPIASLLTWMERKQSAMMQDRIGPNRAAILGWRGWGILHFVADAVKMIIKEDFVPAKANHFLFTLAPLMAIVPVFVTFAIVPFGADGLPAASCCRSSPTTHGQCVQATPIALQTARARRRPHLLLRRRLARGLRHARSPAGPRTTSGRCSAACAPRRR